MFFGAFNHTIDAKGRTALPAKLREALAATGASRLTLMRNRDSHSVLCLPPDLAARFRAQMAGASPFDRKATRNMLVWSTAQELDIDGSGRVLVPPDLRAYAGLEKDVVWAGMGSHILLFDKATFEAALEQEIPVEEQWDPLAGEA